MPYTLWSRGRLLGQTELAYRQAMPGLRAGDFFPNELGERLMSVIDGMSPALFALCDVEEKVLRDNPEAKQVDDWPSAVKQTTEYADAMSIADERESLRLELRDPHGVVVQAEDIWIQDTHRLLALAEAADPVEEEELSEELRAAIEHDVAETLAHFDALDAERARQPWEPGRDANDDEDDQDDPWKPRKEFPRYQIFVRLPGFERFLGSRRPID